MNNSSNKVLNMSDKEFNDTMFEIFNNTDFMVAITKIWNFYNGDQDGCKQWLSYIKHRCYCNKLFMNYNACLDTWNEATAYNFYKTTFPGFVGSGKICKIFVVYKRKNVLVGKKRTVFLDFV